MTERKTAPARKAPAKKAAAAAVDVPDDVSEIQGEIPQGEITFRDRPIQVRMPSPEQVLVWKRTMDRIEKSNLNDWNGEQVLAALERTRKIIDSVIVNLVDIDWIDDEMLAGRFGLKEASQIILDALAVFQNREQRRTTKAAARRKKG